MLKKISKLDKPLRGEITIPSDKSISHRAVMFSSIARGECVVHNFSSGADCHSTLNLFKGLGVDIEFLDEKKSGQKFWERYQKREQKLRQIKAEIDQNEKMLDVMKHSRLWRAYRIFKKL